MKTQMNRDGDTLIVFLDGRLDYENQQSLRDSLHKATAQNRTDSAPKRIIFNMQKLEFVGSSGISNFVQTIREFNRRSEVKPVFCHVRTEFQKVFQAFDSDEQLFTFFDSEDSARANAAPKSSLDH